MISTEKQIDDALLGKIQAAGQAVWIEDGVLYSTDDGAVQAIIDSYTLSEAKAVLCGKVSALAKLKRDAAICGISAGELASWPIKLSESIAYQQTADSAVAPLLSIEAAARGVTLAELVARVASNAQTFAGLEASIAGADGRHRDAILLLQDWPDLYTYDYSNGWPA